MKKRDKTPGPHPTWKRATDYLQDPSSDEGAPEDEDLVHLVRAAAGGSRSIPALQALLQQGAGLARELRCTPDTRATRTVVAAEVVRHLSLATMASSMRLYTAKASERMECSHQVVLYMKACTAAGHFGPRVLVEGLVSRDLTDEVLVSWHDRIRLGVLSTDGGCRPGTEGGVG